MTIIRNNEEVEVNGIEDLQCGDRAYHTELGYKMPSDYYGAHATGWFIWMPTFLSEGPISWMTEYDYDEGEEYEVVE